MRVVLDTNVLMPGLLGRGVCEAVLDACIAPPFTLVLSEHITAEFARHAAAKFRVPRKDVDLAVAMLRARAELVTPAPVPAVTFEDADDLPVLGTAIAGKVAALITGDRALLALGSIERITIVSPRAFYEKLRAGA